MLRPTRRCGRQPAHDEGQTVDGRRDAIDGGEATGQQGYRQREQVAAESTATQGEEQAEGPSHLETGTGTRSEEEASSTGRVVVTYEESDGGARLTITEGVALRETCSGEATNKCRDNGGWAAARGLPPETCEERDERLLWDLL